MANKSTNSVKKIKRLIFLKDVFIIALSAYGGPNMHLALYQKRLVEEKGYLSSDELMEYFSLCQMLPGPSSTQTLMSIGYQFGGRLLAFLTLLVWVLPAFILLTICAIFIGVFQEKALDYLRFVQPVAVGFVIVAGIKMIKKSVKNRQGYWLATMAFIVMAFLRHPLDTLLNVNTPWMFPIVLILAGLFSFFDFKGQVQKYEPIKIKFPWRSLVSFIVIFLAAGVLGKVSSNHLVILFENCYRFGTLVFGGGNVLIPMMLEQFVMHSSYMTTEEFLNGVGLVQAIPGPIFTVASFTGATAMNGLGVLNQIAGSFVSTLGIFLPGALLIFFVFPIWKSIKKHPIVVKALPGVIAASCGLVLAAAYLMFLPVGFNWVEDGSFFYTNLDLDGAFNGVQISIVILSSILLFKTNIKSPWYIVIAILFGVLV
ncbi:MAG: chromate efflux transporter [Bacteroidia bacterium]|mgnify:CR=1 FL=1|nr:chromate efflux transporter [Bacteroidia bacterium]